MGGQCENCQYNPIHGLKHMRWSLSVLTPPRRAPRDDAGAVIRKALEAPIGCAPLAQLVGREARVGLLFDDNTRPTPVSAMLPVIVSHLRTSGVKDENLYLIHAPGLHMTSASDLASKLGTKFQDWPRIVDHDARHSKMTFFGITKLGTPVWANSVLEDMNVLLGLGHIAPHMDAGFSGGHKIILPGVTSKTTTDHNHCLMLSPASAIGRCDGNPVRQDIEEAGRLVGLAFVVNVLLNRERQITDVFAGDPVKAHRAGVKRFMEVDVSLLPGPADVVVACTCSRYLCNCLKALIRADLAVKPQGFIVLLAPNVEAWAPPGAVKRFTVFPEQYMTLSTAELAELVVTKRVDEVRHATAAFNYRGVCERRQVIFVTGSPYGDVVRDMHMRVADSVASAADMIRCSLPVDAEGAVLLDAENVYPAIDSIKNTSTRR